MKTSFWHYGTRFDSATLGKRRGVGSREFGGVAQTNLVPYCLFVFSPILVFGIWWSMASRRAFGTQKMLVALQALAIPIVFLLAIFFGYQYLILKLTLLALAE